MLCRSRSYVAPYTTAQVASPLARHVAWSPASGETSVATGSSRRHSSVALRARGKPANKYVCSSSSSTHSDGITWWIRANSARTCDSVPAVTIAARRTSERVASSRTCKVSSGGSGGVIKRRRVGAIDFGDVRSLLEHADFAHRLAARVANRAAKILIQASRKRLRQRVEQLQHA